MHGAVSIMQGQGVVQIGELLLAFAFSALIGLERQLRGRSAGLRTQAIVGTSAALFLLVSKYGFTDVLGPYVVLDPSRVAAQIVSGIGFLGAGLILTRRGAVRGLTTAASVWETAAIGMASGAGLWLLAVVVTALHFIITFGFRALSRHLPGAHDTQISLEVVYTDGQGLLRGILATITASGWAVRGAEPRGVREGNIASVTLELEGRGDPDPLVSALGGTDGVHGVHVYGTEDIE